MDRPILFKGEMVRAILEGRKTQTRRIIKLQPESQPLSRWEFSIGGLDYRCPYGAPGDRLWVRETARPSAQGECSTVEYKADGAQIPIHDAFESMELWLAWRRPEEQYPKLLDPQWRPSIHMPRWASRITLVVKDVRVERLQDISEEDCLAEGIRMPQPYVGVNYDDGSAIESEFIDWLPSDFFRDLWESINGEGSWGANPWVWVVEFEREGNNGTK